MYTKHPGFFTSKTLYYKDGRLIATREADNLQLVDYAKPRAGGAVVINRAQAYRYWFKHFPGRYYWTLPAPLAYMIEQDKGYVVISGDRIEGYEF